MVASFNDLIQVKRIAIGNPESVPAGAYSVEVLSELGMLVDVEDSFVYTEDVRAVLTYVETGNVGAGIVYKTDARMSDEVRVADVASPDSHEPIIYPVGLLKMSKNKEATNVFYEFLQTDKALNIFEEYGFVIN